jgi:hypothetical protein
MNCLVKGIIKGAVKYVEGFSNLEMMGKSMKERRQGWRICHRMLYCIGIEGLI